VLGFPLVQALEIDGHPLTLDWVGAALGVPQVGMGVTEFGQSGDIASLYHAADPEMAISGGNS